VLCSRADETIYEEDVDDYKTEESIAAGRTGISVFEEVGIMPVVMLIGDSRRP
jgi:hypothetical protein